MSEEAREDRRVRATGRRREDARWSIERVLTVATFIFTAIGFIFAAGINYARLSAVQADIENVRGELSRAYVRQDVYHVERDQLAHAVEQLNHAIDQLNAHHNAAR